jgi:hypothetical protein
MAGAANTCHARRACHLGHFLALVVVAGLTAACSGSYSETTAYPLPSGAEDFPLPTQAASSTTGCPPSDLAPVPVDWDATQRAVSFGGQKVLWPRGFSARMLPDGRFEILAPDGTVVARDGDTVKLGGSDYQNVCRVQSAEYP